MGSRKPRVSHGPPEFFETRQDGRYEEYMKMKAPHGRYASGRPRPKPKRRMGWFRTKLGKWWLKAIERWRKGEVLVEKPRSMRASLRHHRVGVEGHAKSAMCHMKKAEPSINWRLIYDDEGNEHRVYDPIYPLKREGRKHGKFA